VVTDLVASPPTFAKTRLIVFGAATERSRAPSGDPVTGLHFSPFPGARPDWPRCDHCGATPVKVSVRRDNAFSSALFCAKCAPLGRAGDEVVVARVPLR
jgi:hypothetical protein